MFGRYLDKLTHDLRKLDPVSMWASPIRKLLSAWGPTHFHLLICRVPFTCWSFIETTLIADVPSDPRSLLSQNLLTQCLNQAFNDCSDGAHSHSEGAEFVGPDGKVYHSHDGLAPHSHEPIESPGFFTQRAAPLSGRDFVERGFTVGIGGPVGTG